MKQKWRFDVSLSVTTMIVCMSCLLAAPSLMAEGVTKAKSFSSTKHKSSSRVELKSKANQMAAGVRAAEMALSPAELEIAQKIEVGEVKCELGASVHVTADAAMPGYFDVRTQKFRFRMVPVISQTGAIRLEDTKAGAVWLQLANKSMLMSQKLGARLADACVSPTQALFAAAMEKSTLPGLLDNPTTADSSHVPQALTAATMVVQ